MGKCTGSSRCLDKAKCQKDCFFRFDQPARYKEWDSECTIGANSRGLDVEFSLQLPKLSVGHPKQTKRSGDVHAQELLSTVLN